MLNTYSVFKDLDSKACKIVTPHIAGVTKEAIKRMDVELANNIREYLRES